MKPRSLITLILFCLLTAPAQAQLQIDERCSLVFAAVDEAQAILMTRDEYVRRMSPFDRAAKIDSGGDVSEADYLAAVAANVLPWNKPAEATVAAALAPLREPLAALNLPLPARILLIRTNGADEGSAPYTRGSAIILPDPILQRPAEVVSRILCHELFHILSRANPGLREKLYRSIGFEKCGEVTLPADLQPRKITNPDAPVIEHAVRVRAQGQETWVAPVLYASQARFDPAAGGNFFRYLQFRLLTVNHRTGSAAPVAAVLPKDPAFLEPNQVEGFFEQIGSNTGYIIHPEEVLADNFVLLVQRQTDLKSPEIVEKLKHLLQQHTVPNE